MEGLADDFHAVGLLVRVWAVSGFPVDLYLSDDFLTYIFLAKEGLLVDYLALHKLAMGDLVEQAAPLAHRYRLPPVLYSMHLKSLEIWMDKNQIS